MKKRLHQYSEEELKRLYSRKDLYELTQILLDYENEDSNNILNTHLDTSKYRHNITEKITTNNFQLEILKDNNKDNDDYDWINGWIKIITICNDILTWKNLYYNNKDEVEIIEVEDKEGNIEMRVENKQESIQESIHKNDYNDLRNNKATKEEMYLFVWNTLRFTSKRKLQTLVDTYRSLYNTNKPGVKSSNKTISVYDEKDNLITTYKNRNECIESENVSKQNLYKYLKDGKLHKGKRFVESD